MSKETTKHTITMNKKVSQNFDKYLKVNGFKRSTKIEKLVQKELEEPKNE